MVTISGQFFKHSSMDSNHDAQFLTLRNIYFSPFLNFKIFEEYMPYFTEANFYKTTIFFFFDLFESK
jgi:hypothetical protein